MRVDIELDRAAAAHVRGLMERYADRADDMRPVLDDIARDVERAIYGSFRSQGGLIGIGWPPLNPKYVAWKTSGFTSVAARGGLFDATPGVFSGKLGASLRPGGKSHTKRVSKHSMRVGSRAPHAHLFDAGTTERRTRGGANRGRMPARPIVRRNLLDQVDVTAQLVRYLASGGESPAIPGL